MGWFDRVKTTAGAAAENWGQASSWMEGRRAAKLEAKARRQQKRDEIELEAAASTFVLPREYIDGSRVVANIATVSVFFFLFLYCLDEAKDSVVVAILTRLGLWHGHAEFSIPLIIGFLLISSAVAIYCKLWVVIFTQLKWKRAEGEVRTEEGWTKTIALVLGVLTSLIVVMGTFSLTQGGRIQANRPEVEAVQSHDAAIAAAQGHLNSVNADLRDAMGPDDLARPSTQMQACRNTEATWRVRVANTPADDPQRAMIVRAVSDAIRCDGLRHDRELAQQAVQAQQALVVGRAVAARDAGTAVAVDWTRNIRGALLALTCDLLAISGALLTVGLQRLRQRQLAARALELGERPAPPEVDPETKAKPDDDLPPEPPLLSLPPLPDLRGVDTPDFDRLGPVDEGGRRLRKVAGHFRPESPAPKSPRDARRPADPEPVAEPAKPSEASPDEGVDYSDILDRMKGNQTEGAK